MKMVKSLLLGSAAGLVAVAGAQAADMPVKAKPVLYVKICSLYGDGFYYLPGTDICIKIGGYARNQHYWNHGSNTTNGPFFTPSFQDTRVDHNDYVMRARALITVDTRQQTEYGTLRTYFITGATTDIGLGTSLYSTRAFIQFAGFTFGKASSYFDFFSLPAVSYSGIFMTEDTGDGGWLVAAYTANFGNGITGTVSLEEPRRLTVVNAAFGCPALAGPCPGAGAFVANNTTVQFTFSDPFLVGVAPAADQIQVRYPDIVFNWRIDQAWGAAMIGGAVHDASAGYYGSSLTSAQTLGHPADKLGWVATAGLRLNAPGGSFFQIQGSYTEGALRYINHSQFVTSGAARFGSGNHLAVGWATDGIYGTGTEVELTRGWAVYAAYDHVWVPGKWRTSIYGGYTKVDYNDNATALISAATCLPFPISGSTTAAPAAPAGSITGMTNCDPDFAFAQIGSRTQYNFTPEFYMGVDVIYTKMFTAFGGEANYRAAGGTARPGGRYIIDDQDEVSVTFRVHRDFKP